MVEANLKKMILVNLEQHELDALVSFAYNVGCGAVRESKLLRLLNAGKKRQAADEFLNWTKRGGKSSKGLRERRIEEREMFLNGKSNVTSGQTHSGIPQR
jgi:lysozyme